LSEARYFSGKGPAPEAKKQEGQGNRVRRHAAAWEQL
jgi:hypothetical protein